LFQKEGSIHMTRALVRYGAIAEVVRADWREAEPPRRGMEAVLRTPRGEQTGTVLQALPAPKVAGTSAEVAEVAEPEFAVSRPMTESDRETARAARERAAVEYAEWSDKISQWGLSLELLDCERTLDGDTLILYVAGGRGAETTRLALNAVGCGAEYVAVQPVDHTGPVPVETSGGCGTGGCGCGD
jgi:hypothetical protein